MGGYRLKLVKEQRKLYNLTKQLIQNTDVPIKSKMARYKTYFKPVSTYVSEIWTRAKKKLSRTQVTERKFLCGMLHKTRRERICNDKIRETLKVEKLTTDIEKNKLK